MVKILIRLVNNGVLIITVDWKVVGHCNLLLEINVIPKIIS